jgi:hypothetical protein
MAVAAYACKMARNWTDPVQGRGDCPISRSSKVSSTSAKTPTLPVGHHFKDVHETLDDLANFYWSSTTVVGSLPRPRCAWFVSFMSGLTHYDTNGGALCGDNVQKENLRLGVWAVKGPIRNPPPP